MERETDKKVDLIKVRNLLLVWVTLFTPLSMNKACCGDWSLSLQIREPFSALLFEKGKIVLVKELMGRKTVLESHKHCEI